jgi:hypothetical protein
MVTPWGDAIRALGNPSEKVMRFQTGAMRQPFLVNCARRRFVVALI